MKQFLIKIKDALLKPSSFKVGLVVVFLAFLPFVAFPELHRLMASIDSRIHDIMFQLRSRVPQGTTGQVVIVDIDEHSLRRLGQWPWPRNVMGEIVRNIGLQDPKVIGFDMVFAEEDRTSLKHVVQRLQDLTHQSIELPDGSGDNDAAFADALYEADTILGYYFEMTDGDTPPPDTAVSAEIPPPCPEFSIPVEAVRDLVEQSRIPVAKTPVLNIPTVGNAALSEGFFNTVPDPDGVTRRGSLLIRFGPMLYPSLTLEMVREGLREEPVLTGMPHVGITDITIGDRRIPITEEAQLVINFRGPQRTFSYVSAVDVLNKVIPPETFEDKYVLIGTSAVGLHDLRATPMDNAFPGVEVNATIIDNILAGDPMIYDKGLDLGVTLILILVFGPLLAAVLAYLGPRAGALVGLLMLLLLVYGNYRFFFLDGQLLGLTHAYAALTAVFITVSVANYFFEGKKKRFIQGAFSHYVSENVVHTLLQHPDMLRLDGEEKTLSVLFSDICGFTSISEQMTPRELSAFLNEYLSAMTDIAIASGGTLDKFIGDAIMAFWGAPLDDEDHAAHAALTAMNMRRRLHLLQPEWQTRGLPPIDIGIGINSGTMRVGNMGSTNRFDYTVMGDNVNLASRLEGLTRTYKVGILISAATRELISPRFFCRPIDRVRVKGKSEPVMLYEPLVDGPPDPDMEAQVRKLEEAIGLYQKREFRRAQSLFEDLDAHESHPVYDLYLERVEQYLSKPPPEDWDGVYTFTTK